MQPKAIVPKHLQPLQPSPPDFERDRELNQLQVVALIAEREVLRYTPAGMPIVTAVLQHSSQQIEAGIARLTEFEIAALAAGEISGRFNEAPLGGMYQFTGFLAKKSRNSKSLVFHIIDFSAVQTD